MFVISRTYGTHQIKASRRVDIWIQNPLLSLDFGEHSYKPFHMIKFSHHINL